MLNKKLSRRFFLGGGSAVAVSLPFLDAMVPAIRTAKAQDEPATRLAYIYVPYGLIRTTFTPQQAGADYTMPSMLQPLSPLRNKFSVLTGIDNAPGWANYTYPDGRESQDGPGDHARDTGTFLTCQRIKKTAGTDIENGISVDQLAAQHLGQFTSIPSLVLTSKPGSYGGDSGYSPIYRANISWLNSTSPAAKQSSPRAVFNTLFQGFDPMESEEARRRRLANETSILDACLGDLASLRRELGSDDQQKLDAYLTSLRQLEMRVNETPSGPICDPGDAPPEEVTDFVTRLHLMTDLMVLAFQCDRTRVASLMAEGNGFGFLGIHGDHHGHSHLLGGDGDVRLIQQINDWQVAQFARFISALNDIQEDEGTLLDNSLILFGSGLDATGHRPNASLGELRPQASGPVHRHSNLPLLLAGNARGRIRTGQHFVFSDEPQLADLYLTMLHAVGHRADTFGLEGRSTIGALETS